MAIFTSDKSEERSYNKNAGFNEVNRAKRSISLDLADPRGKALFEELVSVSDVVIENYSPRVMPNLGLTYGHLRTLRPDLIMVAMPALGSPGPWSNHISFGPGTEGLGGMCHVTGYQDGPPASPAISTATRLPPSTSPPPSWLQFGRDAARDRESRLRWSCGT